MKFSITIPAYKQKYLYEAIESCLAQTYEDFELIIVDDASPEDLKSVVDQFDDKRIRFYRNEKNCGALNVSTTGTSVLAMPRATMSSAWAMTTNCFPTAWRSMHG